MFKRLNQATDVAARGLDVPGVEHIVNYDLPMDGSLAAVQGVASEWRALWMRCNLMRICRVCVY